MKQKPSLAQRSIASISWNMLASVILIIVGFIRSMLLARWIPVAMFGIYGWAGSFISLTAILTDFGLGGAFVHRAPETKDEEVTAQVHFTLQMILSGIWVTLLIGYAFFFASGETRFVLIALTLTNIGAHLVHTPRLILARRVVHRRLAMFQVINAGLSSVISIYLAWLGLGLWALLATDIVTFFLNIVMFYVWRPVWHPRLTWNPPVMRYFLSFGSRKLVADGLLRALDHMDDLWVGSYLGDISMGYYSRAYTFATYPRKILAQPVNLVTSGTYAELKGDRKRLSQAFYRVNSLLVRSGFLIAGGLALVAPEFIRIVLTEKWMPMLDTFRLMLIYTMFDPIKLTISWVFIAVGKPEIVGKIRLIQFIVLLFCLFVLGPRIGINGVALAVNVMLVVGIVLFLWQVRPFVDFSLSKLLTVPCLALLLGLSATKGIMILSNIEVIWCVAIMKIFVFTSAYCATLVLFEKENLIMLIDFVMRKYVSQNSANNSGSYFS